MKLIRRSDYLSALAAVKDAPDIKILCGMRRAGKSKLMDEHVRTIRKAKPGANVISIDMTLLKNEKLHDYHALHAFVKAHSKRTGVNYLLIDEVQMCPKFELAINSLHAEKNRRYDIYLTGSNAFLLSSDLTTLFTGRHHEIRTYPFSFREYRRYLAAEKDIGRAFDRYVVEGGLAGSYLYRDEASRIGYVREVYQTILRRDIVQRFKLPDSRVLERLAEFLMDNIGNVTSANNAAKSLIADRVPTNHVTVGNYLGHLANAYLFVELKRYDVRGRRCLEQSGKYYLMDHAIRYAVLGRRNMDYGHVYENIVCIELLRRGYEVYVGKLYQKEIDFVAMKGSEKIYIQVSDDISEPKTLDRELEPLGKIRDSYPKLLIARTRHDEVDRDGVRIIDIARWLAATGEKAALR